VLAATATCSRLIVDVLHERLVGRGSSVVVRAPLASHAGVIAHLDRLVDDQQRQERHGEQYAGHGDAHHQFPPRLV